MKEKVPIIEINRDNVSIFYPYLLLTMKNSTFIALDCEMSGLGDRKRLGSKCIDTRYEAIAEAAASRSLLSLGISCFTLSSTNCAKKKIRFKCVTFNILTFSATNFVVEPKSLEFLVKHGFDFNIQYAKGVVYYPGEDKCRTFLSKTKKKIANFCLRQLFIDLLLAKKPIILHNSLMDLVFLYQHLYGPVPKTLQTFIADLNQLFPNGIYDTKYVADYYLHWSASYLPYIFRKCQRETLSSNSKYHLSVRFKKLPDFAYQHVVYALCPTPVVNFNLDNGRQMDVCSVFAMHGHCLDDDCKKSHDIDLVLNFEELKREKKRSKRQRREAARRKTSIGESSLENFSENQSSVDDNEIVVTNGNNEILLSKKKRRKLSKDEYDESGKLSKLDNNNENILTGLLNDEIKEQDENLSNEIHHNNRGSFQPSLSGVHRAGFDAFMTGFTLAYFALKFERFSGDCDEFCVEEFKNRISLSGKDYPLTIQNSAYAKTSLYHDQKYRSIIENE